MGVNIELQNLGDSELCQEIIARIEHAFSDKTDQWNVSIAGSRASQNWELKVTGPNGFERSYTLSGTAGEHEPDTIRRLIIQLVPSGSSWAPASILHPKKMNASGQIHFPIRWPQVRQTANPNSHLDEHMFRALNKIKKPSTADELAELLNRDLGPEDRPFQTKEVSAWLRNAGDPVLNLYWLQRRPRR